MVALETAGPRTELEPAIEKVRAIVEAHPRVLADPAPSVLLDRSAAENALEIVVAFSTAEDETAAVKSDLLSREGPRVRIRLAPAASLMRT